MDKLAKESPYHGILEEYPDVAVDYFAGNSLNCTVYFLSHCHTDHMVGLNNYCFLEKLQSSSDIKLYCSIITKELLTADKRYKNLKQHMVTYDVYETATIPVPGTSGSELKSFLVTLLPAAHCPGSVMFLFEGYGGTVLHTGDFRLSVDDLKGMKPLYSNDKLKKIKKLYIDTTFCNLKVYQLPKRTQSRDLLFQLLDPWLSDNSDRTIFLSLPARYGCEYIFVELFNRYKMKIHVTYDNIWRYKAIADIMNVVTVDGTSTRIHACRENAAHYSGVYKCDWKQKSDYIVIRFSTQWFMYNSDLQSDDIMEKIVKCGDHNYRLCYSMHSSLKEILEFVEFLKPKMIYPLVVPMESTMVDVYQMLKLTPDSLEDLPERVNFGEFGELQNGHLKNSCNGTIDSDLILEPNSISATPPKKIRRLNINSNQSSPQPQRVELSDDKETPEWSYLISPLHESISSSQEDESVKPPCVVEDARDLIWVCEESIVGRDESDNINHAVDFPQEDESVVPTCAPEDTKGLSSTFPVICDDRSQDEKATDNGEKSGNTNCATVQSEDLKIVFQQSQLFSSLQSDEFIVNSPKDPNVHSGAGSPGVSKWETSLSHNSQRSNCGSLRQCNGKEEVLNEKQHKCKVEIIGSADVGERHRLCTTCIGSNSESINKCSSCAKSNLDNMLLADESGRKTNLLKGSTISKSANIDVCVTTKTCVEMACGEGLQDKRSACTGTTGIEFSPARFLEDKHSKQEVHIHSTKPVPNNLQCVLQSNKKLSNGYVPIIDLTSNDSEPDLLDLVSDSSCTDDDWNSTPELNLNLLTKLPSV